MPARSPSASEDAGPAPSSGTCGAGGTPAPLRPMGVDTPGQPLGKVMSMSTRSSTYLGSIQPWDKTTTRVFPSCGPQLDIPV